MLTNRGSLTRASARVGLLVGVVTLAVNLLLPRPPAKIYTVSPGQSCFDGVPVSECKGKLVDWTRDPDAAWYNAVGMCCMHVEAGLEVHCQTAHSATCNRHAFAFIGPRGNQLARGICCGYEPAGSASGHASPVPRLEPPACMHMYESYCHDGTAIRASVSRAMSWEVRYNNAIVLDGPMTGQGQLALQTGRVNGNCCIMPKPGFTTRCEDRISYQLCPHTISSLYLGPRGGGAGIVGFCCKRYPISSRTAAAFLPAQN